MYETMRFLRLFAGFVGVGLTAAALTVTTAYAAGGDEQRARYTPALLASSDVPFWRAGALDEGQSESHAIYLEAGVTYRFTATCDHDCTDVDLRLRNSSGNVVAEDVLADDVPVIVFTVRRSGWYRIEVRMYACAIEPCGYDLEGGRW